MNPSPLQQPGRNCWRIAHAARFALLVDAADCFAAVRAAMRAARHSIFILSWDIDSRVRLVPDGAQDGWPEPLGDFLHALVSARPGLHAWLLNWDFTMLYAMEREWLPAYRLGWRTHRRLHFQLDGHHPVGAAHHQKVIVIDDALAFVGGLDLTSARWDTAAHLWQEPRRRDSVGQPYEPFHDVQAMVDGDVAAALGDLCRERWRRATGQVLQSTPPPATEACAPPADLWPGTVTPDLSDVPVSIARTEPAFDGRPAVREIAQWYLDAIARARHSLLFENQYFTSSLIAEALARRLSSPSSQSAPSALSAAGKGDAQGEPSSPEILLISPQKQSGWLEEATMGVLRTRVHRQLRQVDGTGHEARYRLVCPALPKDGNGCLNVHSKLAFIDDDAFTIGSANLSNRSLACDTECNLCIAADGSREQRARIRAGLAAMRARLLAEHLGVTPQRVLQACQPPARLFAAIDGLTTPPRFLKAFEPVAQPEIDALIPQQAPFDPERTIAPEQLLAQMLPRESREPLPRRFAGLVLLAVVLCALALAWRYTPLRDFLNLPALVALATQLRELPMTPLLVLVAYIVAGVLMVPLTLLIAVTGIVWGAMPGALYALAGSLASATVGYAIGAALGRDAVHRLLGARMNRLSRRVARRGLLAVIIVRSLPLAPFGVVNLVSGASHITLRDYLLGSTIGLLPGVLLTTTFAHHLMLMLDRPSEQTLGVLLIVVLLLTGLGLAVRRLVGARAGDP